MWRWHGPLKLKTFPPPPQPWDTENHFVKQVQSALPLCCVFRWLDRCILLQKYHCNAYKIVGSMYRVQGLTIKPVIIAQTLAIVYQGLLY
jgi:hypothetical protein